MALNASHNSAAERDRPGLSYYVGRFAPSPSGPLHMGSLVAALASYLDARAHNGRWLLRIEDLDPPREQPGADTLIRRSLEVHGLTWDGEVLYQSERHAAYEATIAQLQAQGLLFYCRCSRRQLAPYGGHYPGTCRAYTSPRPDSAIRCRMDVNSLPFDDLLQGPQALGDDSLGDFVIRRRDGLYAYQLAVVVDDDWQGITHVIRGIDLLDSTPRQLYLQAQLGQSSPVYGHIPVLVNTQGQKLSKQHHAAPLDDSRPAHNLFAALEYLRQAPEPALREATPDAILAWAQRHWQSERLSDHQTLLAKDDSTN